MNEVTPTQQVSDEQLRAHVQQDLAANVAKVEDSKAVPDLLARDKQRKTRPPTDQGWGRILIVTRYQPQVPYNTTESFIDFATFGMRYLDPGIRKYILALEDEMSRRSWKTLAEIKSKKQPETLKRLGARYAQYDARDYVASKTMHKAANILARSLLKSPFDSILFIDSDAVFGTNAVEELRNDKDGWEYDALQAFTVKRGWPPQPMMLGDRPEQPESPEMYKKGHYVASQIPLDPNKVYPVGAVSLHFTLIKRWVFEAMVNDDGPELTYFFEYSQDNGEDVTFSRNAIKVGAKLGMTTKLKIGHVSEIVTGWDTMVDYYSHYYNIEAGIEPVPDISYIARYFEAQKDLAALVAEYLNEPVEDVYSRSCVGSSLVADQFLKMKPVTEDELHDFYGKAHTYFYDLINWNSSPAYQKIINMLSNVEGQRVFEFGGGLGTVSAFLWGRANVVDYYDLPGELLEFARWRFDRLPPQTNLTPVNIVERWSIYNANVPDTGYDLVIAIDVLEHLHPDEFDRICTGLALALRPGGNLFVHNNFSKQEGSYPQHFDHSQAFEAFTKRAKLTQITEYLWRKGA